MANITLTYGVLPTQEQFISAYATEVGLENPYAIKLGKSHSDNVGHVFGVMDGKFDYMVLWTMLNDLVLDYENGNEHSGDFASCILATLGIEWV